MDDNWPPDPPQGRTSGRRAEFGQHMQQVTVDMDQTTAVFKGLRKQRITDLENLRKQANAAAKEKEEWYKRRDDACEYYDSVKASEKLATDEATDDLEEFMGQMEQRLVAGEEENKRLREQVTQLTQQRNGCRDELNRFIDFYDSENLNEGNQLIDAVRKDFRWTRRNFGAEWGQTPADFTTVQDIQPSSSLDNSESATVASRANAVYNFAVRTTRDLKAKGRQYDDATAQNDATQKQLSMLMNAAKRGTTDQLTAIDPDEDFSADKLDASRSHDPSLDDFDELPPVPDQTSNFSLIDALVKSSSRATTALARNGENLQKKMGLLNGLVSSQPHLPTIHGELPLPKITKTVGLDQIVDDLPAISQAREIPTDTLLANLATKVQTDSDRVSTLNRQATATQCLLKSSGLGDLLQSFNADEIPSPVVQVQSVELSVDEFEEYASPAAPMTLVVPSLASERSSLIKKNTILLGLASDVPVLSTLEGPRSTDAVKTVDYESLDEGVIEITAPNLSSRETDLLSAAQGTMDLVTSKQNAVESANRLDLCRTSLNSLRQTSTASLQESNAIETISLPTMLPMGTLDATIAQCVSGWSKVDGLQTQSNAHQMSIKALRQNQADLAAHSAMGTEKATCDEILPLDAESFAESLDEALLGCSQETNRKLNLARDAYIEAWTLAPVDANSVAPIVVQPDAGDWSAEEIEASPTANFASFLEDALSGASKEAQDKLNQLRQSSEDIEGKLRVAEASCEAAVAKLGLVGEALTEAVVLAPMDSVSPAPTPMQPTADPSLDETSEWEVAGAVGFGAALYQAAAGSNNSLSVAIQKSDILLGTLPEYSVYDTVSVDSLRVFPIQNFADNFSEPDVEELQLEDGLGFDRALAAALDAKLTSLTDTTASLETYREMVLLVEDGVYTFCYEPYALKIDNLWKPTIPPMDDEEETTSFEAADLVGFGQMLTQAVSSLCKVNAETKTKVDLLKGAVEDNVPNPTVYRQDLDSASLEVGAMTLHESPDHEIISVDDFARSGFKFTLSSVLTSYKVTKTARDTLEIGLADTNTQLQLLTQLAQDGTFNTPKLATDEVVPTPELAKFTGKDDTTSFGYTNIHVDLAGRGCVLAGAAWQSSISCRVALRGLEPRFG
ncbi:uncharacterized protein BKA78DRAFT_349408 [Phyllosticta capitalensis]|uniref:uncharacterized protein n=1 Tax=Phyllosticta capitalensis TaxID=121624 RepID=UPI00312CEFA5